MLLTAVKVVSLVTGSLHQLGKAKTLDCGPQGGAAGRKEQDPC